MHILVIGTGSIGQRHVRCFQQTGRATVSIVETNAALRQTIAERYNVQAFETMKAALACSAEFDAAVIATPAHLHVAMALILAAAGKHLLIEKPLSTSLDQTQDLMHVVSQQKLIVAVAYVYRCFPALVAMKAAIDSGKFGRPLQLVANCGQNFPTYRPAYRQTYYTQHVTGGGAIQDALTHIINAGQWLVGPVDKVVADADHLALPDVEVEDTVHVLARHGRVLASYSLNQHQAPNETTITVVCEQGTVAFDTHLARWRYMTRPDEPWQVEGGQPLPRDAAFVAQAGAFLDAIESGLPIRCSLAEGLSTLQVNLAILASVRSGTWQEIERIDS